MSTNKTPIFGLHLWEPGDDFLRAEFNENFAALDAAARMVCGTYTGDGTESQFIDLGFRPKAVLVEQENGTRVEDTYNGVKNGLALSGFPMQKAAGYPVLAVESTGFRAYTYAYPLRYGNNNDNKIRYFYIAFR